MYDPELYRNKGEVELWKQRDPIEALAGQMREAGELSDDDLAAIESDLASAIAASADAARAAPAEDVGDLEKYVYTPRQS
jgi:pyruvate dehydrogenase E1 component alpha subunit